MGNLPTALSEDFSVLLDSGDMDGAASLIRSAAEVGSAEAIFLSSTFSRPQESVDEFELRSLAEVDSQQRKGMPPRNIGSAAICNSETL